MCLLASSSQRTIQKDHRGKVRSFVCVLSVAEWIVGWGKCLSLYYTHCDCSILGSLRDFNSMTTGFSEALSSLRLQAEGENEQRHPAMRSDSISSDYGRSVESASSFESNYTRRGQTETESDLKAGLAAARDLASKKKFYRTDKLSSSPLPGSIKLPQQPSYIAEGENEAEPTASGAKTPLPDTSACINCIHRGTCACLTLLDSCLRRSGLAR